MQRQEVQVCYQGWGWELSEWDGGSVVVTDISEAGCMATGVHQENGGGGKHSIMWILQILKITWGVGSWSPELQ